MPLHRLLHRLDYQFNEFISDRPGAVINKMLETGDPRIPEIKDITANRMLVADVATADGDTRWRVQVTPLNAYLAVEWRSPREIGTILRDPEVMAAFKVFVGVFELSNVDLITRAGLRFFAYRNIPGGETLQKSLTKLDPGLLSTVKNFAGEVKDVGINFEGQNDDGIAFSIRHGPYFKSEQHKYFEFLTDHWEAGDSYNYIVDVDFAQTNFRMKGQGPNKWSRALLDRAEHLTNGLFATGT